MTSDDPTGFGYVGIPEIYSWWGLLTLDFGVVQMTMTAWNSSTNVGTFQLYQPWVNAEFGPYDLSSQTNLSAEVQALTTIYADERTFLAVGSGIVLRGVTTESEGACETIIDNTGGGGMSPP
jgi:hypothetical protein